MKIIAISDLHGDLPTLKPCDVVCITGDIFPLKMQRNMGQSKKWLMNEFKEWTDSLPCKKVIFIAGNHDFYFQENPTSIYELDPEMKLIYLQDNLYEYEGIRFYGSPWCPNLRNWAFYKSNIELDITFRDIPENIDVLLTHCPPKVMDYGKVMQEVKYGIQGMDLGCAELTTAVLAKKPRWHIFGHIHSGNHTPQLIADTYFANVSIKDEDYNITYEPLEFEINPVNDN